MQNRYTGDIGDFGKLGLLRAVQSSGLTIGVNWYLVPDENHNADGRYIQYLENERLRSCDESLWMELKRIVNSGQREVSSLQSEQILKAIHYSELLDFNGKTRAERMKIREEWHKCALTRLSGVDVVFVDPDNGLVVPSVTGTAKENKYVKPGELLDYYSQGSSIIYYQHKARLPDDYYIEKHRQLASIIKTDDASGIGLKFTRTSQRFFFFMIHPFHRKKILNTVHEMMSTSWSFCFDLLSDQ